MWIYIQGHILKENVPFDKCEKDHSVHVHVAIATNNMHVSYTCTHQNSQIPQELSVTLNHQR